MIGPATVIDEARTWLGVPFAHQGRTRRGVDCVGLPIVVGQGLGLVPARFEVANYGRLPSADLMRRLMEHCTRIAAPVPGSLVAIAWTKSAAHVAICTGDTLIHSYESVGRVIEHGYRGRWVRLTHSAWALPGVIYGQ